jgi:hypothetical protein
MNTTTLATIANQIASDVINGKLRGNMGSSAMLNVDDARKAIANNNAEAARASVLNAARYAYGILDSRFDAIVAAV